jgi:hypothetical protein
LAFVHVAVTALAGKGQAVGWESVVMKWTSDATLSMHAHADNYYYDPPPALFPHLRMLRC